MMKIDEGEDDGGERERENRFLRTVFNVISLYLNLQNLSAELRYKMFASQAKLNKFGQTNRRS